MALVVLLLEVKFPVSIMFLSRVCDLLFHINCDTWLILPAYCINVLWHFDAASVLLKSSVNMPLKFAKSLIHTYAESSL